MSNLEWAKESDNVGKQALIAQDAAGRKECERQIWNAAIEAAAEICKHSGYFEQIRSLKK